MIYKLCIGSCCKVCLQALILFALAAGAVVAPLHAHKCGPKSFNCTFHRCFAN